MLGLGALAALERRRDRIVYGVVGAIMEFTLGLDVLLIGVVDSGDAVASGCA